MSPQESLNSEEPGPAHLEVGEVAVSWCTGQYVLSFHFSWRERQSKRVSEEVRWKEEVRKPAWPTPY